MFLAKFAEAFPTSRFIAEFVDIDEFHDIEEGIVPQWEKQDEVS